MEIAVAEHRKHGSKDFVAHRKGVKEGALIAAIVQHRRRDVPCGVEMDDFFRRFDMGLI